MAKKKYYQSKKDRRDESRGMKMSMREGRDGFIQEDRNAPANLPQNVVHHYYPANNDYRQYDLNDTIQSIDVQMDDDSKGGKRGRFPEKY